jgi:aspartate/methionine/tyrosine aminotransferase
MNREYERRKVRAQSILSENLVNVFDPGGAFYLWIDIASSGLPSASFCRSLLERHQVAVVPGSAFGPSGEGYIRASVASSESDVATGMTLLAQHLHELADVRV